MRTLWKMHPSKKSDHPLLITLASFGGGCQLPPACLFSRDFYLDQMLIGLFGPPPPFLKQNDSVPPSEHLPFSSQQTETPPPAPNLPHICTEATTWIFPVQPLSHFVGAHSVQGLLPTQGTRIMPGGVQGTICGVGDQSWLAAWEVSAFPAV